MDPTVLARLLQLWAQAQSNDPIQVQKLVMERIVACARPVGVTTPPGKSPVDRYFDATVRFARYFVVGSCVVKDVVVIVPPLPGWKFQNLKPQERDSIRAMAEMWLQDESRLGDSMVSAVLACEDRDGTVTYVHNGLPCETMFMLGRRRDISAPRYIQYTARMILQLYHMKVDASSSIFEDAFTARRLVRRGNPKASRNMRDFAIRAARSCSLLDSNKWVACVGNLCAEYPTARRQFNGESDDWPRELAMRFVDSVLTWCQRGCI